MVDSPNLGLKEDEAQMKQSLASRLPGIRGFHKEMSQYQTGERLGAGSAVETMLRKV